MSYGKRSSKKLHKKIVNQIYRKTLNIFLQIISDEFSFIIYEKITQFFHLYINISWQKSFLILIFAIHIFYLSLNIPCKINFLHFCIFHFCLYINMRWWCYFLIGYFQHPQKTFNMVITTGHWQLNTKNSYQLSHR